MWREILVGILESLYSGFRLTLARYARSMLDLKQWMMTLSTNCYMKKGGIKPA